MNSYFTLPPLNWYATRRSDCGPATRRISVSESILPTSWVLARRHHGTAGSVVAELAEFVGNVFYRLGNLAQDVSNLFLKRKQKGIKTSPGYAHMLYRANNLA